MSGYIRGVEQPNRRRQDVAKTKLLCGECEAIFQRAEARFAEEVFHPLHREQRRRYSYVDWLLRFAVSLAWRAVVSGLNRRELSRPELARHVNEAAECWRRFLIGDSDWSGPHEHHLFFVYGPVESVTGSLPQAFHWYMMRGTDATIALGRGKAAAYVHIPGMIFWSAIRPERVKGMQGTRLKRKGIIGAPQRMRNDAIGNFVIHRIQEVYNRGWKLSDRQDDKVSASWSRGDRQKARPALDAFEADLEMMRRGFMEPFEE